MTHLSGTPRVSCIIPAYNAETLVRETIESALAQTLAPFEIIVVDDGSTDRTAEVVAALPPPVRLLRQANAGQQAARNLATSVATGELFAFLDADDLWEPEKLRLQVELLRSAPPDTVVFAHAQNFWSGEVAAEGERLRDQWVARPFTALIASTMLVSRDLFERVGGFDVTSHHGEVAEWLDRARAVGARVAVHPAILLRRRIHAANSSRTTAARDDFFALLKTKIDAGRDAAADRPSEGPRSRE
jgi:glycosyltransferase involved in cell wall biosynthesis